MRILTIAIVALLTIGFAARAARAKGAAMLKPGDTAPLFTLPAHNGDTVSLASFKGEKFVVLVFYPGDQTPGCTKQLCELRDNYAMLQQGNAVVFGLNQAGGVSHGKFIDKYDLPFPLLIDEGSRVAALYRCKGKLMTERTVYVVDPQGAIVFAQRGMPSTAEIRESIGPATPAAQ